MESLKKGKYIVIIIITLTLLINIGTIISTTALLTSAGYPESASENITTGIVRLFLTGLLCLYLYRGKPWAKWVSLILYALGGISALLICFSDFSLWSIIMATVYLVSALLLLFSKDAQSFMEAQDQKFSSTMPPSLL